MFTIIYPVLLKLIECYRNKFHIPRRGKVSFLQLSIKSGRALKLTGLAYPKFIDLPSGYSHS